MSQIGLFCKHHPSQTINNFCKDPHCLVGLCPTCIGEHTSAHISSGTQPSFENIRQTYTRVHQEMKEQIETIEEDQERLDRVMGAMEEKKSRMREVILRAKEESVKVVEEYFCELERRWENEMRLEEKKHSLHDEYKLQGLASLLSREKTNLIEQRFRISARSLLDQVPKWEKETKAQSRKFHLQTIQELEANEKYAPIIHYYPQHLSSMTQALKSALQLQFNIPIQRRPASFFISNSSRIRTESNSIKKEPSTPTLSNQSVVVRRVSSAEKVTAPSPRMTQSALYAIPSQLTNSSLTSSQNVNKGQAALFKTTALDSPKCKINFAPKYVEGVDLSKYARSDRPDSHLKQQKKTGIMLFSSHNTAESLDKENSKVTTTS